ncbi:MAG: hypothetical protein ACR2QV_12240 [Gammaproteobacteria bacterium]
MIRFQRGRQLASVVVAATAIVFAGDALAQRAGQSMTVQTGIVVGAQAVNLQSEAGRGALVGGTLGAVTTSSRQGSSRRARNAIIGGAAGAAIASRAQGSLDGMQFTVEIRAGTRITVVTDQTEIRIGDCVNVEQGGSMANVRRVSPALCEAAFDDAVDDDIVAEYNQLADMCLAAKERLLDAETDAQIEAAIRRVDILCDD